MKDLMKTAVVVGAGGFGRHHARILSEFGTSWQLGTWDDHSPSIDKVVVTRTDYGQARQLAEELAAHSTGCEVVGAQVASRRDLQQVLEKYSPTLITIAARDKNLGDRIHIRYSKLGLRYSHVFCEKPFAPASGNGRSLQAVEELCGTQGPQGEVLDEPHLFALDLPYAVVRKRLLKSDQLSHRLYTARRIELYWASTGSGDILNDLALHPWSLLPDIYTINESSIRMEGDTMAISLQLHNTVSNTPIAGCIFLRCGATERRIVLDGYHLEFMPTPNFGVTVVHEGKEMAIVPNPLEEQISALLHGAPIAGKAETVRSQQFLETITAAYKNNLT